MRIEWALRHHRGIAKTKDLQRFGVSRDEIYTAMREGRVLRIRNGWFCLPSAHPMEVRAVSDRGLLTCSAAARVLGLPAENNEYHLRAPRPVPGVRTNCRRLPAQRIGGLVTLIDLVEDYAACQAPAWTLALLDALVREARVSADDADIHDGTAVVSPEANHRTRLMAWQARLGCDGDTQTDEPP